MPRLTLRTLLAYIDDTLGPDEARSLGKKVAESDEAKQLVERIKKVTRRRGLAAPTADEDGGAGDPNTVAEYLDNALDSATLKEVEETCLESDVHLAEVAACHQILTLVLTEPVRVAPRAHHRMYGLVQPPASVPNRKPSKVLAVSSTAPPVDGGAAEADDADAALLFGLKRYSATTWATRFGLFAAAAVLLVALGFSVMKSLPESPSAKAPEVARGPVAYADAGALPGGPPSKPPVEPAPKPDDKKDEGKNPDPPAPKPKEPDTPAPKPKEKEPDPKPLPKPVNADKWDDKDAPPAPLIARGAVGRLTTENALVVAYRPKGPNAAGADAWVRQAIAKPTDADDANAVFSAEPVMALPGYKANILLGEVGKPAAVDVLLWGNIPEQLPYRVFESKVVFHKPQDGFDADLTLHAGRIYLKSVKQDANKKPVPAKVRVRLAGSKEANREVWDVTLPDPDADVLVELISWYMPGTPFELKGAYEPRREARATVVRGPVGIKALGRAKSFDDLPKGAEIRWDSAAGTLSEPAPNPNEQEFARTPTLGGFQKILTDALSDMAKPGILSVVLKDRLNTGEGVPNRDWIIRVAIYSWAAMAESTETGCATLKELVELLNSGLPFLSRQAVITALVQWVGREKGNTALLHARLSNPDTGVRPTRTADAVVEMLRGYVAPTGPDPERLNELVKRLSGVDKLDSETKRPPAIALRDVALWNLVVADLGVWIPPPVGINVGAIDKFDTAEYAGFLNFWQTRVNEIKKRTPPKTP